MTELGLSVAAYDIQMIRLRQVVCFLFLCRERVQAVSEHTVVQCEGRHAREWQTPAEILDHGVIVGVGDQWSQLFVLHDKTVALPPVLDLLLAGQLVVLHTGTQLGVLLRESHQPGYVFLQVFTVDELLELLAVEVTLGSLLQQVWVDNVAFDTATENVWVKVV